MKLLFQKKNEINFQLILIFLFILNVCSNNIAAQVTFLENTVITNEAFYFWKVDDPKPYHYGASINPHGNCLKVSNGYMFYTWYRGGWADRTLMVSRKKIGEGNWVHVGLPAKLSLVGGKGDTHLTTNIGICPIDGTIHLMFDHHNEDLNYIRSKKNIAFGPDSDFTADNFLPQQDYLIPGKKITSVTYPDLFNNDLGEMYFERRLGSAVGGDIIMTYYNGDTWSQEVTIIKGRGSEVTQGERGFSYGSAYFINGKFYYAYSPRWAESPTRLNEGVYVMELGSRMDSQATTVNGKSYDLPIVDHTPFLIADPRSVPDDAGWAGGPQLAISPKNDMYTYIKPKGTNPYNYLRKQNETEFSEDRNKGSLGVFYGNRMYKFNLAGGDFVVTSALAGTYTWREDFRTSIGINDRKSITVMDNGIIAVVFSEAVNSATVPIHCFVFQLQKEEYIAQTINFGALAQKTEGDPSFTLNATASSGLPVSYTSSNTNIARIINGNEVQIMGVGSCDIMASQKGDGTYNEASEVSQTLVVSADASKSNQTITFSLSPNTYTWGSPDQVLNATASSGLAVQYESTNTDVASIVNGKIQVKRAGTTTINALQPGDATYNAAPIVGHEYSVPIRQQVIDFSAIPEVTSGDPAFTLQATSNNPDANLRFLCPNNQVAVVWDDQVRQILGAGTATITVSDTGNDYFTAAQASKTLTVNPKIHQIPSTIEAEYYTSKSGVSVTRWSNTVFYLNSWNTGDFAEYTINAPEDGDYEVEVFAASPGSTKKLKIVSGTTTLASIALTTTPSLTNFKGTKATISLQKGVQNIKVVGEVGGFNYDKMKISATSGGGSGGDDEGVYQLVNVATGQFLIANPTAGQPVSMNDSGDGQDRKWEFIKTSVDGQEYYNIDSRLNGILRATGANFSPGAYLVVSTGKAPPAGDTDKIWTIHYDEFEDTYRFEARSTGRFLYHHPDGNCYNYIVDETDERSQWQVVGSGGPLLSVENNELKTPSLKVYPNPSQDKFTIAFKNINVVKVTIYNILGKAVYEKLTNNYGKLEVKENFESGIYLVKAFSGDNRVFHAKLIVK
ncbi:BNR-4 repeat-containing protein [Tamlana fucoidanivorans]|uniref:T9SS type A sorting domain-containing protein n=1 Tax=Allotamlana fucoidanivorans TaxID=2583814 RepID=A0A5C4SMS0_9FLAO|nr:BNR-4 repeat-containing protein [Tamlana fucoidanivorans]TNJ45001.1 T9SS type A sorting domain-containing protein [Tamlana fucoidanivorans]